MPERETLRRAKKDKAEGKVPTTQAGEFIREEMDHIREGKHGARSTKQAIAIGLSKARRAGVKLPPPKKGTASEKTRQSAERATRRAKAANTIRRVPSARGPPPGRSNGKVTRPPRKRPSPDRPNNRRTNEQQPNAARSARKQPARGKGGKNRGTAVEVARQEGRALKGAHFCGGIASAAGSGPRLKTPWGRGTMQGRRSCLPIRPREGSRPHGPFRAFPAHLPVLRRLLPLRRRANLRRQRRRSIG